ncbi:MAG: hypothetical protein GWN62_16910 [Aliifodinibius sp.]|nr:hypothetical protein [Fodinibius sp.]
MSLYTRPNAAQSFVSIDAMLRSSLKECKTIRNDVPAATAALPQFAATVQEYVSVDRLQDTIVCSGTWETILTGELCGVLVNDEIAGTTDALYITSAPRILVPHVAAGTVTKGADVYFIEATGLFTHDAMVGDFIVGKYLETAENTDTGNLPAGDGWALIELNQAY